MSTLEPGDIKPAHVDLRNTPPEMPEPLANEPRATKPLGPHRAGRLTLLALLGILTTVAGFDTPPLVMPFPELPVVGLCLLIGVWVVCRIDLHAMKRGTRDKRGELGTLVAEMIAVVAFLLGLLWFGGIMFLLFIVGSF